MSIMHNVVEAARIVFCRQVYIMVGVAVTLFFLAFEIALAHYALIAFAFQTDVFSWKDRLQVLGSSASMFFTVFPLDVKILAFITALIVGLNLSCLAYYLHNRMQTLRAAGSSLAGVLLSMIGVGCSACGSVVLSSLIGFGAATQVLAVLPLRGKEFSLLAILILTSSTYWVMKKIIDPEVCRVK